MRLLTRNICPYCGSNKRLQLISGAMDINHGNIPGEWSFWKCKICKSIYIDPVIHEDDLLCAYSKYETHTFNKIPEWIIQDTQELWSKIKLGYLFNRYNLIPGEKYKSYGKFMYFVPPYIRAEWDAYMMRIPIKSKKLSKLLDIGCGSGDFMLRARLCGWEAKGVDFDIESVATAKKMGLNVIHGSIDSIDKDERFDVVTISNVIEHVLNPKKLIHDASSLLNANGRILILTPNSEAPGLRKWGKDWTTLDTPRHISMMSTASLNILRNEFKHLNFKLKPRGWHLYHTDMKSMQIQRYQLSKKTHLHLLGWHIRELISYFIPRRSDELFIEITKK